MSVVFTRAVPEGGIVNIERSVPQLFVNITSVSEYLAMYGTSPCQNVPVVSPVYVVSVLVQTGLIARINISF